MAKKKTSGMVDAKELQKFQAEFNTSRQEINDLHSAHANILKDLESKGYNKEAFKQVCKLLNFDIAKAQDYDRAYKLYSDVLGLTAKLDSQGDLIDDSEAEEESAVA